MPKEKVTSLLQQLHNEIEQQDSLTKDNKERFTGLIQNIEQDLGNQSISEELSDSLNETVTEFEAKYPRLTAIINDIMVTLSNIGI